MYTYVEMISNFRCNVTFGVLESEVLELLCDIVHSQF